MMRDLRYDMKWVLGSLVDSARECATDLVRSARRGWALGRARVR